MERRQCDGVLSDLPRLEHYRRLIIGSVRYHQVPLDIETQAWYLKLLNRVDPHGERAAGVARHLMLNRVYGDHWKSTRDTAIAIEALAEFAKNNHPKPGTATRLPRSSWTAAASTWCPA